MRYLILSDIHANWEGLEACLAAAQGKYDEVLCLGDLVGYGPDPNAVIERIRALSRVTIRGNHDKACSGLGDDEDFNPLARLATDWTRQQLTVDHMAYLRSLPSGPIRIGHMELVHGSPLDEDEYVSGPIEALPALLNAREPLVFFGHTHIQGGFMLTAEGRFRVINFSHQDKPQGVRYTLEEGCRYLINPGSVGQPRDRDWRAAFAVLDQDVNCTDFYRVPYDIETTQNKMAAAGLPSYLAHRLSIGR